jgi:hypothetical protein
MRRRFSSVARFEEASMKIRILACGAALAALLLMGARTASAQNWCYDWCYSTTSCDDACYNGYWTTCGEWHTCDFHYCSWSSICNSGVECITECYDGSWPDGEWTTCGDAGKDCFICVPDYQWQWYEVGKWNVVDWINGVPWCQGYKTMQHKGYDVNECIQADDWLFGDCDIDLVVGPIYNDSNCCDNMGGCWGEVWPSSCT